MQTISVISPEERVLAALTHLSGLAGYIIPLGGIIVPVVIWIAKKESAVITSIAKQAVILNIVVWVLIGLVSILWLTIILIPIVLLAYLALGLVALVLPIIGAVKASDGTYYRYPVVGVEPAA
jgi:uncharacterized Tic20 family protein